MTATKPWYRWRFSLAALTLLVVLGEVAWLILAPSGTPLGLRALYASPVLIAIVYIARGEWRNRNAPPQAAPKLSKPWYQWSFSMGAVALLVIFGHIVWTILTHGDPPAWIRAVLAAPFLALFACVAQWQWQHRQGGR